MDGSLSFRLSVLSPQAQSRPLTILHRSTAVFSINLDSGIARGGNLAPSSDVQLAVCAAPGKSIWTRHLDGALANQVPYLSDVGLNSREQSIYYCRRTPVQAIAAVASGVVLQHIDFHLKSLLPVQLTPPTRGRVQTRPTAVRSGAFSPLPATSSPSSMISGTAGGGLCLWTGRNCSKAVKEAHSGAVEVLSFGVIASAGGGVVASGGRDAKVKLWSSVDLSPLATLDVMATPSVAGLRQVEKERLPFLVSCAVPGLEKVPSAADWVCARRISDGPQAKEGRESHQHKRNSTTTRSKNASGV